MSIALALLSAIFGGAADFCGGVVTKRLPVLVVVSASQMTAAVIMLVIFVFARPNLTNLSDVLWAAGAGAFVAIGLVSFYAALAVGTMSVVAPISGLGVLIPLTWGILLDGLPSRAQIVAISLAVGGAVLAGGAEIRGRAGARPIVLAAVSAGGFGGSMATLSEASGHSPLVAVAVMKVSICVLLIPVAIVAVRRTRILVGVAIRPHLASYGLIAVLDIGATSTQALAFENGPMAIVSVVAALYPVATVLLARWILTERLILAQRVGVGLAILGLILLGVTVPGK